MDIEALQDWLVKRQMSFEGGFNGRSNKLVDGCYCFWVGGALALIDLDRNPPDAAYTSKNKSFKYDSGVYDTKFDPLFVTRCVKKTLDEEYGATPSVEEEGNLTFNQNLLQRYILLCAQDTQGGLRDKPSKGRDFYHSCYNLSGLSVAQHVLSRSGIVSDEEDSYDTTTRCLYQSERSNLVGATHPVYNIKVERIQSMVTSFECIL